MSRFDRLLKGLHAGSIDIIKNLLRVDYACKFNTGGESDIVFEVQL